LFPAGPGLEIQWRNVTKARVQGFETSFRGPFLGGGLECTLGYTYVYPWDLTSGDILKYRPRHLLHSGVRGRLGWLSASADFRFSSRIERIDDELVDAGVIPDGDQRVPIYVTDIRVGADLSFAGIPLSVSSERQQPLPAQLCGADREYHAAQNVCARSRIPVIESAWPGFDSPKDYPLPVGEE
jgi:hypothetical protein